MDQRTDHQFVCDVLIRCPNLVDLESNLKPSSRSLSLGTSKDDAEGIRLKRLRRLVLKGTGAFTGFILSPVGLIKIVALACYSVVVND